jgi:hypothetical protein
VPTQERAFIEAEMQNLSRTYFESAITDEAIRVTRIIHLALIAGPLFFLAAIVFITFTQPQSGLPSESQIGTMDIFTLL